MQLKANQYQDKSRGAISNSCETSPEQARNIKIEQMLTKITKTAAIENDQEAIEVIIKIISSANLETLQEIIKKESSSPRVFAAVASHPITDTAMLNFIAKNSSSSAEALLAVLGHQQIDSLTLQEVINNQRATAPVLVIAAKHRLINRSMLESIIAAANSCDAVLAAVAYNDRGNIATLQNVVLNKKAGVMACKVVVQRLYTYETTMGLRNYQAENICKICAAKGCEENDLTLLVRTIEVRLIEADTIDEVIKKYANIELFYSAACNPVTNTETLIYIIRHQNIDIKTLCAIIRQPNTTTEMLDDILENHANDDPYIFIHIAENPRSSTTALIKLLAKALSNDYNTKYMLLAAIAQNPNTNEEILDTIMQNITPIGCDLYIMPKLPDNKTVSALLAKNPNAKYIVIKDTIYVIENQHLILLRGGNWIKGLTSRGIANNITLMHLTIAEQEVITAKTDHISPASANVCLAIVKNPITTSAILQLIATITPEEYFDIFAHIAIHENISGELLKQVLDKIGSSDAFAFELTKLTTRLSNQQLSVLLNRLINLYADNKKRLGQIFTRSPMRYMLGMNHLDSNKKSSIIARLSRNDILLQIMHKEGERISRQARESGEPVDFNIVKCIEFINQKIDKISNYE